MWNNQLCLATYLFRKQRRRKDKAKYIETTCVVADFEIPSSTVGQNTHCWNFSSAAVFTFKELYNYLVTLTFL